MALDTGTCSNIPDIFYSIVGYLMPSFKATRLQHIQDILAGRKKALLQREVPARHMPKWPELSVKIIYPQMLAAHPDL